jgi:hypothetical protein
MTFSFYKIIVPGIPYLIHLLKYIKIRSESIANQLELERIVDDISEESTSTALSTVSRLERFNPEALIEFFNNLQKNDFFTILQVFKILYTFGKGIAILGEIGIEALKVGEFSLILTNAGVDLQTNIQSFIHKF